VYCTSIDIICDHTDLLDDQVEFDTRYHLRQVPAWVIERAIAAYGAPDEHHSPADAWRWLCEHCDILRRLFSENDRWGSGASLRYSDEVAIVTECYFLKSGDLREALEFADRIDANVFISADAPRDLYQRLRIEFIRRESDREPAEPVELQGEELLSNPWASL
jgi:hypothetical protein